MDISSRSQSSGEASGYKCKHTGGIEFEKALQRYQKHLLSSDGQRLHKDLDTIVSESHDRDRNEQAPIRL